MIFRPALRFLTRPRPPADFAARRLAAVILPPLLFFAIVKAPFVQVQSLLKADCNFYGEWFPVPPAGIGRRDEKRPTALRRRSDVADSRVAKATRRRQFPGITETGHETSDYHWNFARRVGRLHGRQRCVASLAGNRPRRPHPWHRRRAAQSSRFARLGRDRRRRTPRSRRQSSEAMMNAAGYRPVRRNGT